MNYEEVLWAEIYDEYNQGRHQSELKLYGGECKKSNGKCLEIATGTGMILLPLLEQNIDIQGFDISEQMLSILRKKASDSGLPQASERVSKQNMTDFQYEDDFDLIIIPARSFLHLGTQEDQINTLVNVRRHLKEDGRLILNFFVPNYTAIQKWVTPSASWVHNGDYKRLSDGALVNLFFRQSNDVINQIQDIEWKFRLNAKESISHMKVRWIFKEEFQLLLQVAGFSRWELFGDFNKNPFSSESKEMIWEVKR